MTLSLRARLTLTAGAVLGLSLAVFSGVVYGVASRALWKQFDEQLIDDAHIFAKMVEEHADGPMEFEPGLPDEFDNDTDPAYFELWTDDGVVLGRTPALKDKDLVPGATTLPDGRPGRTLDAVLAPRTDDESPMVPSGRKVRVMIARSTLEVDSDLATLRLILLAAGLSTLMLAALAATLAVRRGFRPLDELGARLEALGAEGLHERLPASGLPRELQPVVARLNELLERLDGAFVLQRQFNADVSHELRTPLTGLRSVLEVAVSRQRTGPEYAAAMHDALAVVEQMRVLVENLLLLARLGARQILVTREDVQLKELVDECFVPFAERARMRKLRFENRVALDATVCSDTEKLRIVVSNLLGNAVDYTAEGGQVWVDSELPTGRILEVRDSGPEIPVESLEAIFDPFVRLESSRAGTGEHAGIGLSLVRTLCTALGFSIRAENLAGRQVAFRVER